MRKLVPFIFCLVTFLQCSETVTESSIKAIRTASETELIEMEKECKAIISEPIYKGKSYHYDLDCGLVVFVFPIDPQEDFHSTDCYANLFVFHNNSDKWELTDQQTMAISGEYGECNFELDQIEFITNGDQILGYNLYDDFGNGGYSSKTLILFHINENKKIEWINDFTLEESNADFEDFNLKSSFYFSGKKEIDLVINSYGNRGNIDFKIDYLYRFQNNQFNLINKDSISKKVKVDPVIVFGEYTLKPSLDGIEVTYQYYDYISKEKAFYKNGAIHVPYDRIPYPEFMSSDDVFQISGNEFCAYNPESDEYDCYTFNSEKSSVSIEEFFQSLNN